MLNSHDDRFCLVEYLRYQFIEAGLTGHRFFQIYR